MAPAVPWECVQQPAVLRFTQLGIIAVFAPFELEAQVIVGVVAFMGRAAPSLSVDMDGRFAVFNDDFKIAPDSPHADGFS